MSKEQSQTTDLATPKSKISVWDVVMAMLAIAVLEYIAIKAYGASFTHDESFSYSQYVHTPFMDILTFKDWFTNNHILNTIGMKWSEAAFGNSEFALRLPNLLLFVVYLAYSYLLFRRSDRAVSAGIFALLATNIAIIDFFGLARGYGLSWGFMLMSLYHFIAFFEARKFWHIALFHLGSMLAVLSNFALLDVYLAFLCVYPVREWVHARMMLREPYRIWPSLRIHLPSLAFSVLVLYEPLRRVITKSDIDFGGKKGFYADTVKSLVGHSLHKYFPDAIMPLMYVVYTAAVLVPTAFILRAIWLRKIDFWERHKGLVICNALLIVVTIAINLQHLLLGADFPVVRFSLYLLVLFLVHLGFVLAYLAELWPISLRSVALTLAGVSSMSLLLQGDLRSCAEWEPDMETKAAVQALTRYHLAHGPKPVPGKQMRLGIDWIFEPALNFYRVKDSLDWLMPVERNGLHPFDNYNYVMDDNAITADTARYEVIVHYERIHTILLRNRRPGPI